MFQRFFVGFLTFAFFSVQANAATHNSLKAAFDQLNYSLSVEWDQKDRAFQEAKTLEFNTQVAALQAQGLTNEELSAFAISQVKDKALAAELQTTMTMIQLNKLSTTEARNLIMKTLNSNYSTGANWSGDTLLPVILGVVLIAAVVAALGGNVGVYVGDCYEEYVCDFYGCYYDTYCY